MDNRCKVVEDPAAAWPVTALSEPFVMQAVEQLSDPEARSVAKCALRTLLTSDEGAEDKNVSQADVESAFKAALGDKLGGDTAAEAVPTSTASLAVLSTDPRCLEDWPKTVGIIEPFGE
eukprot:2867924-Alexandrium_andersonii.AAC.1